MDEPGALGAGELDITDALEKASDLMQHPMARSWLQTLDTGCLDVLAERSRSKQDRDDMREYVRHTTESLMLEDPSPRFEWSVSDFSMYYVSPVASNLEGDRNTTLLQKS